MPNDIDEKTFETSFAEMALTALKSRASLMIDYMMGFQLVERAEDDTRAAGFFGFKIGHTWAYVPAIFCAGEVKGMELLYVKEQDLILPLEEGWINYLIQRRPFVLGKGSKRDVKRQGISGPDIRRLRVPPSEAKLGHDQARGFHIYGLEKTAEWAPDGMQMLLEKAAETQLTLPTYLAERGLTCSFVRLMRQNPKVAAATLQFYTLADLEQAQKRAASAGGYDVSPGPVDPENKPKKVRVLDRQTAEDDHSVLSFLSDEEKKRLMTGQVLIDDQRDPDGTRRTYGVEISKQLTNPTEPGLYDVLTVSGDFAKMLVLIPTPVGGGGTRDLRLVVDPQNGEYQLTWKTQVWTAKQYPRQDLEEALTDVGQPMTARPTTGSRWEGPRYIVIDSQGSRALGPFVVDKTLERQDTTSQWLVRVIQPDVQSYGYPELERTSTESRRPAFEGPLFSEDGEIDLRLDGRNNSYSCSDDLLQILVSDKRLSKIVHGDKATMVPRDAGFRLLRLGEPLTSVRCMGSIADLHMGIGKFAEVIKVYNDGLRLNIVSDQLNQTVALSNQKQAYDLLLNDLDLDLESAREILKTAQERPHHADRYFAFRPQQPKLAAPFDRMDNPPMGTDPELGVPIQELMQQTERLPEHQTEQGGQEYRHHQGENDAFQQYYQSDMKSMDRAAQSGQRDVFDAAAIGSLINIDDVGGEIDSYVPRLIGAIDKLGRILFLLYWHAEDVQERYGKKESREMEDNIKAVFQSLGDAVLALKKQSPADEDFLSGGNFGE